MKTNEPEKLASTTLKFCLEYRRHITDVKKDFRQGLTTREQHTKKMFNLFESFIENMPRLAAHIHQRKYLGYIDHKTEMTLKSKLAKVKSEMRTELKKSFSIVVYNYLHDTKR